jgi:hypothetical protein
MSELQWITPKLIDDALNAGLINDYDKDYYSNIWGKSTLTLEEQVYYDRINDIVNKYRNELKTIKPPWKPPPIEETLIVKKKEPRIIPFNWDKFSKIIEYQNSILSISLQSREISKCVYIVRLDRGEWPDSQDLLTLCDGDVTPNKRHFGGDVEFISENTKYIEIYID